MDMKKIEIVLRNPLPNARSGDWTEENARHRTVIRDRYRSTSGNDEFISKSTLILNRSKDRDAMSFPDQEMCKISNVDLNSTGCVPTVRRNQSNVELAA
jgi:hypothetical protein